MASVRFDTIIGLQRTDASLSMPRRWPARPSLGVASTGNASATLR
jgi:hypothetical protein